MAAAGLQRSSETFRRSGSSGLVWEDRSEPGEQPAVISDNDEGGDVHDGGPRKRPVRTDRRHRTFRSASPAQDPPSPRVSACGFWALLFGKSKAGKTASAAASRRRQR